MPLKAHYRVALITLGAQCARNGSAWATVAEGS